MKQKYKLRNGLYYLTLTIFFVACLSLRAVHVPYLSAHITNFALTGLMLCLSLYIDLHRGSLTKRSFVVVISLWVFINMVVELFVRLDTLRLPGVDFTNFNTPDPFDALFGILGAGLYAWVISRYCTVRVQ